MEILEGEALYRMLLERYSRRPAGWSFTVSQSPRHGFFDVLVGSPDDSWHLKLDSIYKPSPFILGARTERPSGVDVAPISFGFRRIEPRQTPFMRDGSPEGMARLLAFLSSERPVAPTGPGSYIQGPVLFTSRDQIGGQATEERRAVDNRLSDEMQRLLRRRYPNYS